MMKCIFAAVICFALINRYSGYTWDKYIPIKNDSEEDFQTEPPTVAEGLSPVILVPGLGGSELQAKLKQVPNVRWWCLSDTDDYYHFWAVWYRVMPGWIDCWLDNMRLRYDNVTHKAKSREGFSLRFPNWKRPESVRWVAGGLQGLLSTIADNLVANDYVRGQNLFGAPYDFRKGPKEQRWWFKNLKRITEHAYYTNDRVGVTYIGHSMGGRMILNLLQMMPQNWKDKFVKRAIFIGVPWGGTVLSMKVMAVGHSPVFYLPATKMKRAFETFSSLAWLMPSEDFWNRSEVLVTMGTKNYTVANIGEFFNDIGIPNAYEMKKDQSIYKSSKAPGVEVHVLYGSVNNTLESLDFGEEFNSNPKQNKGSGDAYVNMRSLLGFKRWYNTTAQGNHKIYHKEFIGIDHVNIVDHKGTIDYILKELKDDKREYKKPRFLKRFRLRIPIL